MLEFLAASLESLTGGNTLVAALYAGLFVAATTSLGSTLIFFFKEGSLDLTLSLAFAAGVMLVASFTSLILPALNLAGFPPVALGTALGVLVIHLVDRLVPHEHLVRGYEGPPSAARLLRKAWLVALAVIIHNLPEGLAVGTSMAYSIPVGMATALAIGLQDVPEGLAVAMPVAASRGRRAGVLLGILSGFSETLTAVVGAALFTLAGWLLPLGLSFAGGAMLYVTLKEAVPEIYREDEPPLKITLGFLAGFYLMLFLDSVF